MFNLSSMKMGLDQAVLKGFESSSGDAAMSKAEVENLLKHGAYAILNEDKAGTAENASNEFASQSIDDILARRTRTIVHEGSGTGGSNAGGTFSKASFKLTKSPEKKDHGVETQDLDISDPDFWKKMLGDSYKEEETTHLDPKQRRRKMQTNYNEDQNFQTMIAGDASDYSYESDADDDVEEGMKDNLKERATWGGLKKTEWTKEQVDKLESLLCSYGYGNFPWKKAIMQLNFHAKETEEFKRMAWAMVLFTFLETVKSDVAASAKRAQKAAEKQRDSSESANNGEGGVLASNPANLSPKSKKDQIEAAFQKLLHSNRTWASTVLADAVAFARCGGSPRDPEELTKAISPQGHRENSEASVKEEFSKTVWSSLKNRGWAVKLVPDGPLAGSMVFSYQNQTFSTISDTVRRARSEHPELAQALDTISELAEAENKRSLASLEENRKKHLALDFQSATAATVEDFLVAYAPFQLLVDREKTKNVGLGRRLINSCALMDSVFSIIKRNQINDCQEHSMRKLALALPIDKRRYVPHPEWTSYQDAVLLLSLFRHGSIENEMNFEGILRDPEIKWGPPFEKAEFSKDDDVDSEKDTVGKAKWEMLVQVATRAVQALSRHSESDTFRNVNKEIIATTYGIERNNDGEWNIKMSTLETKHEKVLRNNCLELPGRKELVKRTKALLTAISEAGGTTKEASPKNESSSALHKFTKLDIKNPCNLYLVELLRGFVKSPVRDKDTGKDFTKPMCELLVKEAQVRADEEQRLLKSMKVPDENAIQRCENSQQILKHVRLVESSLGFPPRLYKNVVRVILGDNPFLSKSPTEPSFPPKPQSNLSTLEKKARFPDMMLESHGIKAIREARDYYKRNPTSNFSVASNVMYFTEIETLILSVACQHGIPAFSESWTQLVDPENSSQLKRMSWVHFGAMLEKFSSSAEKRPGSFAADEAKSYSADPEVLAKKTVMIFSKFMHRIGMISSSSRSDQGLGSKVVKWLTNDLTEWAKALQIVSTSGEPLTFTASDFIEDCDDQDRVEVVSAFDKQRCRDVFAQVAALCRLQSAVATCSGDLLVARVQQASANCLQFPDDLWREFHPKSWKIGTDDLLLVKRLTSSGFLELIENKSSQGVSSKLSSKSFRQCGLNERILQHRVNELVRELHEIESHAGRDAVNAIAIEEAALAPRPQVHHQPRVNRAQPRSNTSKQRFV